MEVKIIEAGKNEIPDILKLIYSLAEYEHMENLVGITPESLESNIINNRDAKVLLAILDGEPCGYSIFYKNFSTFLGKPGIYIEDLFVREEFRGKGAGTLLMKYIINYAKEINCGRIEWACLKWNTRGIKFYKSLGAKILDNQETFRLTL